MNASRAFTLAETMVVVAVIGVTVSLAVTTFRALREHASAREDRAAVLSAVANARTLSQRQNAPVEIVVLPHEIQLATAVVTGGPESVRRVVTSYALAATVSLPRTVNFIRVDVLAAGGSIASSYAAGPLAVVQVCPSSDSYFRNGAGLGLAGQPVCGVGNLASADAKIVFVTHGETHHVRVRAALGTFDLRDGA